MSYWHMLSQTVAATCQSGQIGTPVFVRCTAALAEEVGTIRNDLAQIVQDINEWLAAFPRRLYASGSPERGQISLTLEYPSGPTALVALSLAHAQPQVDLTVLGSQGAIYHHQLIQPARDGPLKLQSADSAQRILAAIEQSLTAGSPIDLKAEVVS
jgi:hypothetical protein